MPTTVGVHKRARKSIAPSRPPLVPPPSTNAAVDRTVCHLCGYLGRTRLLSIDKNGYAFLRQLPPAPGALPVTADTQHVRACNLCALLLDKQRETNNNPSNFFFKGFFRSTGTCNTILGHPSQLTPTPMEEQPIASAVDCLDKEVPMDVVIPSSSPRPALDSTDDTEEIQPPQTDVKTRSMPPPLLKTTPRTNNSSPGPPISDHLSSLDSFISSIRTRFLADYTALMSSSSSNAFDSCALCSSLKPHGTLDTLQQSQFSFLSSVQIHVCTLCYYNLMDQLKLKATNFRRPRPQCYLCHRRVYFAQWEIKLLEIEYLPFLLRLYDDNQYPLYDNKRLALACDGCFYALLFQYIDQQRRNIPIEQRTYTWQCTYPFDDPNHHHYDEDLFYTCSSSSSTSSRE